jgi:hypothetical protein
MCDVLITGFSPPLLKMIELINKTTQDSPGRKPWGGMGLPFYGVDRAGFPFGIHAFGIHAFVKIDKRVNT